jgi:hypothetical protein
METVVESIEMAPGALPHPGRVPEQRILSLETRRWRRQSCGTLSQKTPIDLGFWLRRVLNRRRGGVRGRPGAPHHPLAHPRGGATPWCGGSLAPLRLSFGLHLASGKNRRFGLRFVQFREYFLCSFSETQKQQKTGNWHCGISSIG